MPTKPVPAKPKVPLGCPRCGTMFMVERDLAKLPQACPFCGGNLK